MKANILNMEEWKQENSVDMTPLKEKYEKKEMSASQFKELQASIQKAKNENRREKMRRLGMRYAAAAAALMAAFVILPNTSATVANAMGQIPLLGELVEVVTFRNYQYEDERHKADVKVPELVVTAPGPTGMSDAQLEEALGKTTAEINAEIQARMGKLMDDFTASLQDEMGYQDIHVTSEVLTSNEDFFTLKVFCYQGAGSGYQWNYYYTIDMKTGERMRLTDLFIEGADYITPISENIKIQMAERMAADEGIYFWLDHEIEAWNFKAITPETSFYVNGGGNVVIAFDEGEVGPMSTGAVEFEIPAEVISGIRK